MRIHCIKVKSVLFCRIKFQICERKRKLDLFEVMQLCFLHFIQLFSVWLKTLFPQKVLLVFSCIHICLRPSETELREKQCNIVLSLAGMCCMGAAKRTQLNAYILKMTSQ